MEVLQTPAFHMPDSVDNNKEGHSVIVPYNHSAASSRNSSNSSSSGRHGEFSSLFNTGDTADGVTSSKSGITFEDIEEQGSGKN